MFSVLIKKIFGSANDRFIKSITPLVKKINSLEESIAALDDSALRDKTQQFKNRLSNSETMDDILPEAFAVVREATKRVTGKRHFDVQLLGGIVLHKNMITEMKTGEGKTLTSVLPVYLNALEGKGVHVVTINDYLAQRDAESMGQIYNFLGLTVGCITGSNGELNRKEAYLADITYGTNNEFGFDYLRDHMRFDANEIVQRGLNYAIVDEVDSALIDEVRTSLIISGKAEENVELYGIINQIIRKLPKSYFEIDEKMRTVILTEEGNENLEKELKKVKLIENDGGLYDLANMKIVHHLNQSLKAHHVFKIDVDYVIQDKEIMIIDEFTGRILKGRRYSDGLHQAIEAKEGVVVQNENQTIASITFQNYFRMYKKLAGMAGTAMTESKEFMDIYKLNVVAIPTHMPVVRKDDEDIIYRTTAEKYKAIINEIEKANQKKQPVLIGTVSIEKSEYLSKLLKKHKIPHNVLNAKHHMREAEIIAQAGRASAVTVATNMAGRGTDIMLGGNVETIVSQKLKTKYGNTYSEASDLIKQEELKLYQQLNNEVKQDRELVQNAGGLLIIGTERHESRRIDNQLRGRSGRQGDPGRSVFYLSLEDDLMRMFGSDKISNFLGKLGLKDDEAITHPWISKSLEKAQQKVEAHNFEMRKTLLQFDDVINQQRHLIYDRRVEILQSNHGFIEELEEMSSGLNQRIFSQFIASNSYPEEWDLANLQKELRRLYSINITLDSKIGSTADEAIAVLNQITREQIKDKARHCGNEQFADTIRYILIVTLDQLWRDHLHALDHLRAGINLRSYGQQNPLTEYKIAAFELFRHMLEEFDELVIQRVMHSNITPVPQSSNQQNTNELVNSNNISNKQDAEIQNTPISRNKPCPCGSDKRFKHCHGAIR